jgi:hypothetical protein
MSERNEVILEEGIHIRTRPFEAFLLQVEDLGT